MNHDALLDLLWTLLPLAAVVLLVVTLSRPKEVQRGPTLSLTAEEIEEVKAIRAERDRLRADLTRTRGELDGVQGVLYDVKVLRDRLTVKHGARCAKLAGERDRLARDLADAKFELCAQGRTSAAASLSIRLLTDERDELRGLSERQERELCEIQGISPVHGPALPRPAPRAFGRPAPWQVGPFA